MPSPPTTPVPDEKPSWWSETRLVTLLVAMALIVAAGVYLCREYMIVGERKELRKLLIQKKLIYRYYNRSTPQPSLLRRFLGDEPDPDSITMWVDAADWARVQKVFLKTQIIGD